MKYIVYVPVAGYTINKADEYLENVKDSFEQVDFFDTNDRVIFIASMAVDKVEIVAVPSKD